MEKDRVERELGLSTAVQKPRGGVSEQRREWGQFNR